MRDNLKSHKSAGLGTIFKYAVGDGASSIAINGANNFAMIYMTQILHLNPAWASLAISISILWDAVTDPPMGHISDNARSRWGRRHPFILVGGVFVSIFFFIFWFLPQLLSGTVFVVLAVLLINLCIRTAMTVYMVPYTALGYEICPEYEARARLQGVRFFVNQVTNFTFGAMAWSLFFQDRINEAGERVDGSLISSNYRVMGAVLALFIVLMVSISCFGTRRYALDNRAETTHRKNVREFWTDFTSIFKDRLAVRVFSFFVVAQFAMMLMGQMQMFTYIFFMQFRPWEKTLVHGAGMLAFAFASLNLSRVVRRYDKKQAGYIGMVLAMFGGLGLLAVFTGGLLHPQQVPFEVFGKEFSAATIVFGLLQMCWWGGCGMVVPLAGSMVADIAAINYKKTGVLKNASYASVFSFSTKAASSIGILICGWLLQASGIISGAKEQTAEAVRNISILTFMCGPIVMTAALLLLRKYPVDRGFMEKLEEKADG